MNSKDYDQKVNSMLTNECTYVKLPSRPNPINQISTTVNQYVWKLYRNQKIDQKCYYYLHCTNAVSPRFYGLPKVHKSAVPLRPIVSCINSPAHNVSKFLSRILSGLVKNNYNVCNSREFVEYVKNCHVQENEIFVSFDVVSLFTSVPVDKAFNLVLELLSSDDALPSPTSLSISDIEQGLKICLDSTIFSYKDSFTSKPLVLPWVLASSLSSLTFT